MGTALDLLSVVSEVVELESDFTMLLQLADDLDLDLDLCAGGDPLVLQSSALLPVLCLVTHDPASIEILNGFVIVFGTFLVVWYFGS